MRASEAALLAGAGAVLLWPRGWSGVPSRWPSRRCDVPVPAAALVAGLAGLRGGTSLAGPAGPAGLAGLAALAGLVAAGPVAAGLAAVCAGVVASGLRAARVAGAAAARRDAELEFLAALAAELRSGRHPVAALSAVQAPADAGLEEALVTARATAILGGDVSASMRRAGACSALSRLAAAWQLSEESGAPLADLVAQVATDVRSTVDLQRDIHIELTGARATGLVLALLPLLGVALGAAMGAQPLRVLLHTPAGAVCVAAGLAFELVGLVWVRRLTSGGRWRGP